MKKATMQDVADKAKVSITTVSRYLNKNGYVAKDKQMLIDSAMQELGYSMPAAKTRPRSNTVGHIIPRSDTTIFYDRLSASLVSAANDFNYHSVFAQCDSDEVSGETLLSLLNRLYEYGVNGIIVSGITDDAITDDVRKYINNLSIPVVFVERTYGCAGFNRIEIDTKAGMIEAVHYLLTKGHKQILYLDGHKSPDTQGKRMNGFLEAIKNFGSEDVEYWIQTCISSSIEDCKERTAESFRSHPDITGIIAWSDLMAAGALQYLHEAGKNIPNDVLVVGYDDIIAPLLSPPISSVHMPIREMALAAVQIIADSEKNPFGDYVRTVLVEPKLILR